MRGLYAIIDPDQCDRWSPLALAEAVLRGGCAALQLRAKRVSDREYLALATPLQAACRAAGVPFVVNDRFDLAVALAADGLHVGQGDAPIELVRTRFAGQVGVSTHSLSQLQDAFRRGADLVGFGPVFDTASKVGAEPTVGVAGLRAACAQAPGPVVAIGGIQPRQLANVVDAGPACVAVIGALARSEQPEATARAMHTAICAPAGGAGA